MAANTPKKAHKAAEKARKAAEKARKEAERFARLQARVVAKIDSLQEGDACLLLTASRAYCIDKRQEAELDVLRSRAFRPRALAGLAYYEHQSKTYDRVASVVDDFRSLLLFSPDGDQSLRRALIAWIESRSPKLEE